MSIIIKIKKALKSKDKHEEKKVSSKRLLSLGSALLNLACTGRLQGGVAKEDYLLVVGDSNAGKTWISLTALAEAANNPEFEGYTLYYDNIENGAYMDFGEFWGERMAKRVLPPRGTRNDPQYSSTVQEFWYNLDDALNKGPCIYVLDSMDALDAEEDIDQFQKEKTAHRKGKQATGSYGMSKAKRNSGGLRSAISKLRKTGSILVIIAQTRDKVNSMIPNQKTRGGGKAMKFYGHVELWLSIKKDIEKDVGLGKKKKRQQQGIVAKVKVEKSRHTGREVSVEVPIYWSRGIDDIGSCVDYLVEMGHWRKKKGGVIFAKELRMSGKREDIIKHVERKNKESVVHRAVKWVWVEIKKQLSIDRKSKYI